MLPSLDVACFVGGSYYFCVQIILMKQKGTKQREIDLEVNNYDIVCRLYKDMLVKPVLVFLL